MTDTTHNSAVVEAVARARFKMAVATIERDVLLHGLTDAEIDCLIAAMPPHAPGWRTMDSAPRDGTRILALYKSLDGYAVQLNGRIFEVWHEGVTPSDYDLGWALCPGYGGVPDKCLAGWMPKPPAPLEKGE